MPDTDITKFFDLESLATDKVIERFIDNLTVGLTRWERISEDEKLGIRKMAAGLAMEMKDVFNRDDTGKTLTKPLVSDEALGVALVVAAALLIIPNIQGARETLVRSLSRDRILKTGPRKKKSESTK